MTTKPTLLRLFLVLLLTTVVGIPRATAEESVWELEDTDAYIAEFGEPYSAIVEGTVLVQADSDPAMLEADGIEPDWASGAAVVTDEDGSVTMMPMMVFFDPHSLLVWLSSIQEIIDMILSHRGSICIKPINPCQTGCQGRQMDIVIKKNPTQCQWTGQKQHRCRHRNKTVCRRVYFHRDNCKVKKIFGNYSIKGAVCN